MIVGMGGLFLFEDGIDRAPRKLFFAAMVLGVFVVAGFVTYQLSKVVGERVASTVGALLLLAAALAFVLWVFANWGG